MKKLNTSPISGMQELLPQEQAVFNKYKEAIREVYHRHGFLEIETPTIDRAEILFAKAGGETEKQIYKVIKTDESADDADQALRFDHTVPLARYVVEHESNLNFPFKVTQVGRNFRGERAQKGRFREFYQCDIDVIGRNAISLNYDVEIIMTLTEALSKIISKTPFLVRISNRKILSGFIEERNLQEVAKEIFSIIDHSEKVSIEKTRSALIELKIGEERVSEILELIGISGDFETVLKRLKAASPYQSELFNEGVNELCAVLLLVNDLFKNLDINARAIADLKIVRGLDYYTGTVFETILPNYPEIGSVCSGGRYENLAELYTDQKFPGVGGSIGLTRLFHILSEHSLIDENIHADAVDFALVPLTKKEEESCFKIASDCRNTPNRPVSVDVVLNADRRLGDRIKYATKLATYVAVVGPDELAMKRIRLKNFITGDEIELKLSVDA